MVLSTCPNCGSATSSPVSACAACTPPGAADDLPQLLELEESLPPGGDGVSVLVRSRLEFPAIPRHADPIANLLVDLTPSGPPVVRTGTGPVAHVILLLDLSASMNHADKYPVLTEALGGMLHQLSSPRSADVLLSVVVFAWGSATLFRDVPARGLVPREVMAAIDASPLRFGRYTDAAGALRLAGRIAADQLRAHRGMPTRIYLLTDGRPQDLPRTNESCGRLAAFPVDVDALAFGGDADVPLLQNLVSGGRGGTVKHVRTETLGDAFDRIAEVSQRVVSNRAIVEFEPGRGVIARAAFRYRPGRHRYADTAFDGGRTFRTDLGALEAGRTYSLLFELRIPESRADVTDVGRISVKVARPDGARTFGMRITVPRTIDRTTPPPDPEVCAARDILAAVAGGDAETQLRALRLRREAYVSERRDPRVVEVIDKAIRALETDGSLAALSESERSTLQSHTCTAGGARPPVRQGELAKG